MDTAVRKITLRPCQKKDSKQDTSQVNPFIIFKIPQAPQVRQLSCTNSKQQ